MQTSAFFFEDIAVGDRLTGPSATVERGEMVAFAEVWDPLPIHVDEAAGRAAFGSLTAAGIYILAVKQRLIHGTPFAGGSIIASLGYDELRFLKPVRPGDRLTLAFEWVDKRPSGSKPDRGIVKVRFTLINQHGEAVMSHLDTVLVRRREYGGRGT
jgi:acyl dehydratase